MQTRRLFFVLYLRDSNPHPRLKLYQTPIANWLMGAVPGAVSRLPATDRRIYLTFDDGPHPNSTPLLIELLKQHTAPATHFLLGERAAAYPEGVEALLAAGHRIGNHSWTHRSAFTQSPAEILDAAHRTGEQLLHHGQMAPMWYRPPYGHLHPMSIRRLNHRYKIALWSIMPGDFDASIAPETLVKLTLQQAAPGKIIVLHDSPKVWPRLQLALPKILDGLKSNGYSICALP